MRHFHRVVLSLFFALPPALFAQAAAAKLSFEAATIKPAPALNLAAIANGQIPRVGMSVQGTRVDIGYMSLADLIPQAFNVKPFQVSGPDWLRTERFEIQARMPEGTTKEQVPEMLQALLAERFQLKIHHEMRENSVYALVVAKGGHKMKEAEPDPEVPPDPASGAGALPNGAQVKIDRAAGGATITTQEGGAAKMSMTPDGHMRMEMSKMTMPGFVQMLTGLVDKPVVDLTELKGKYQVALDVSMDNLLSVARASGMNIPGFAGAGGLGGQIQASDPSGSSIFTSLQQLGLKLEPRKEQVDFIVIDHVEKTPTEN
jgi:uncharacterized protein (TIGR03435 family)